MVAVYARVSSVDDDLVRDVTEILTSLCARLYGRRAAVNQSCPCGRGCHRVPVVSRVLQAYRFALDPNDVQTAALCRHAGAARFAFTWGLARVTAGLSQRDAERSYGIPDGQLTPVPWTLPALRTQWNQATNDVAPWWPECSKEAFSAGLAGSPAG
jgi:hypothetical protein